MGFDDADVYLEGKNSEGGFYAGDIVKGKLVFQQNKVKTFRGIYVVLKGECHIHWTTHHTRTVDGKQQSYTVNHNSHEIFVDNKMYLVGGQSGEQHLNPGKHNLPFQIMIPVHCPSSFEGSKGNIRYHLKFVVDRALKFDQEKSILLNVTAKRDLNADPYCKEPIEMDFTEAYCCWCMNAGTCEIEIRTPASGYCAGQVMAIDVNCANKSNVEIDTLKFEIKEERSFRATHEAATHHEKNVIAKIKKGPVPGNTTRNWTVELAIPQMTVYNVDACQYIDIHYEFAVEISASGCHEDSSGSRRIILGHVPLREFEDGPPDHTVNQFQSTAPPLISPGYPVINQPYPAANQYPSPNPAFPGFVPAVNSPYPPANPPYPSVSPYPGPSPPYTGTTSPYPGANLPNSGTSSPYPGGVFPGGQPLPNVSPYPAPSPYPGAPLLPTGAGVPYPSPPAQQSPYATATAPEPATPDTDMPSVVEPSPAYNPNFKEEKKLESPK